MSAPKWPLAFDDELARLTAFELPVVSEPDVGKPKENEDANGKRGQEHGAEKGQPDASPEKRYPQPTRLFPKCTKTIHA